MNAVITPNIKEVSKEELPTLNFVDTEVLYNADERKIRSGELYKAMILGNINKLKSRITFVTKQGIKKVETTVWSADDEEVLLKYGTFIPTHAILKVDIL